MVGHITRRLGMTVIGSALIVAVIALAVTAIPNARGQEVHQSITRIVEGQSDFNTWNRVTYTVPCPEGFYVVSGGGRAVKLLTKGRVYIRGTFPFQNGWRVEAQSIRSSDSEWALHVWAVCSNA